jgi:RNA 2',3'-cyclic 3'-phosphodiesterase
MRMFIAIDLPPAVAAEVRAICKGLPAAHWSNPAQLHLTLRFLGEMPAEAVEGLRGELSRVTGAGFELGLRGVGVFPKKRRPARVLWTGVTPEAPACALKDAIDAVLGPDPEAAERGFSPHLTLARFRDDPGPALADYLARQAAFASATWAVGAFHLYKSTIGHDGAVHELVQDYPLAAR